MNSRQVSKASKHHVGSQSLTITTTRKAQIMGATERWVWIRKDGVLMVHTENDGWTYMRRGLEKRDWEISLEELRGSHLYERAVQLLAEWKAKQKP